MKKAPQKPLMLAYIVFLFVCTIYHCLCGFFDWNFDAWEKIIVAATMASFFFSISSFEKYTIELQRSLIDTKNKYVEWLIEVKAAFLKLDDKKDLIDYYQKEIEDNLQQIAKENKSLEKNEKKAFYLTFFGHLVFFCVMSFDWLYSFFAKSQDVYALLAFVTILTVEYWESTQKVAFDELCKNVIQKTNSPQKLLENQNTTVSEKATSEEKKENVRKT